MDLEQSQTSPSSHTPTSTQNSSTELVCRVCGAPAYGYNFDQITCESCKAFFRRNALHPRVRHHSFSDHFNYVLDLVLAQSEMST